MFVCRSAGVSVLLALGLLACVPGPLAAQTQADVLAPSQKAERLQGEHKLAEAAREFEKALRAARRVLGEDHVVTAGLSCNLANVYRDLGEYARAEPLARRGLEILEARRGKDHLEVADALNILGALYSDMSQFDRAEPLFRRSLHIYETRLGPDDPNVARCLSNLAGLYSDLGLYARAEPLRLRSLRIREATLGKDHPDTAWSVMYLAFLYERMGRYARAEHLFQRSLQIREKALGPDHPYVAPALDGLAGLYRHLGQYDRAEPLLRRSLAIREAALGKDHLEVAHSLGNLAILYTTTGQYARAEALLRRGLEIREAREGQDHPHVANELNTLAGLYGKTGQYARAEALFLRGRKIAEAKFGQDHPEVAQYLYNLADLYREMGQLAKAEPLFRRSLAIYETTFGMDHPHVAESLNGLADNAAGQKDWAKAVALVQRARQTTTRHLAEVLPVLTEREQLTLLRANVADSFYRALSVGWLTRHEAAAAGAEWLLNGQAVAHQSLAEQQLLARDAKDPAARQLVEELQQIRSRLAALLNRRPPSGQEADYRRQVQELTASEQRLAQQLARAVGRPYRPNPWVPLEELRARLGPRTAFVDIARFPVFDFATGKWQAARYVAWVTPPRDRGDVQVLDLGEAEALDRLVERARQALLDSAKTVTRVGEVEAAAAAHKPLQELAARVLHPLLPAVAKYEEWVVCPDGALWLVPWSALPLPGGPFAVEKHLIRHVVSGRDLVLEPAPAKAEAAYLFADPDYDLAPARAAGGLRGRKLPGAIGARHVAFEFREREVVIYDADRGAVAGRGTWRQEGDRLTIQTQKALFQGVVSGNQVRGQRHRPGSDGQVARDPFRIELAAPDEEGTRTASAALAGLGKVPRLPGTAQEAVAVRSQIRKWLGGEPEVFLQGQASKARLKALGGVRLLALATHGYFLPAPDGKQLAAGSLENPLLRCGLLLAGCNRRAEARAGQDDGVVTGLEIVGLDLRGCELVVLSACQTGLGEVRQGEGVAGLRQAFQLAGARGVLASLWEVADRETALLMQAFYSELAKGRTQAEALRQAQLQRLTARRQQFGAAHPFFWAAFTLTSRGAD
jgi:tetratricopeptide (TPR) repeat protein